MLLGLPAQAARLTTAQPPHLAILYPKPGYAGSPIYFDRTGIWDAGSESWTAVAAVTSGSLQLAAGYRLRLFINHGNHEIIKPEDDADFSNDEISSINRMVIEPCPPPPPRPRVFLAPTGNRLLAKADNDSQWRYVQAQADGVWFNCAGISWPDIRIIVSKLHHRVIVNEQDSQLKSLAVWKPLAELAPNHLLSLDADFQCTFEATALFKGYAGKTDAVPKWNSGEVAYARQLYASNSPPSPLKPFPKIYTGWEPFPFCPTPQAGKTLLAGTAAEREFNAGDGAFMECDPRLFVFNQSFRYAVTNCARQCHAAGKPFLWFMSHFQKNGAVGAPDPKYVQAVKNAYYLMEAAGLLAPNDVWFIVNYDGSMQCLPEVAPTGSQTSPTLTGIMYWLLHQGNDSGRGG